MTLFFNWTFDEAFRQWVKDPSPITRVHLHRSPILREGLGYVWAERRQRLMGLTTVIDDVMITYDAQVAQLQKEERRRLFKADRKSPRGGGGGGSRHVMRRRKNQPKTAFDTLSGAERGTLVHRQIVEVLFCPSADFFKNMPGNHLGMHPYVPRIMHLLLSYENRVLFPGRYGIRPLVANFRTYSPEFGIATEIDLMGVDQTGSVVFVELKTGYGAGRFERAMDGGLWTLPALNKLTRSFPLTPCNKAIIQIVLGGEMCIRELDLPRTMVRYVLLRVDDEGGVVCEVNPQFAQLLAIRIFDDLKHV
jgi:hypothetical protein